MATFRVLVHGHGLVLRRWLLFRQTVGFYATRFVEAESVDIARQRVLADLRGDPKLALSAIRPPALVVEEVEEIQAMPEHRQLGLVFYPAGKG